MKKIKKNDIIMVDGGFDIELGLVTRVSYTEGLPGTDYICLDTVNKTTGKQVPEEQKVRGKTHWTFGSMIIRKMKNR